MIYQIEITTHCNFKCFYCVGRKMPQRHMERDVFEGILHTIPAGNIVNLQGEGEPSLHPLFWEFVDQVIGHGCHPFTITNGTLITNATLKPVLKKFPHIGVSLDSIDESAESGRYNQKAVLSKIETLAKIAGSGYVTVYITDYGQEINRLTQYLEGKGIRYIVQPIQTKPDYIHSALYMARIDSKLPEVKKKDVVCRFVLHNSMRYYNVDGVALPCCFIKDTSKFQSIKHLADTYRKRIVPECCFGCRELTIINR